MNDTLTGGIVLLIIAILITLFKRKNMGISNKKNDKGTLAQGGSGGGGIASPASSSPSYQPSPAELSAAPDSVRQWVDLAKKYAEIRTLPWRVVLAEIWQESYGDPNAVSSANARGLMQLKQIAVDDCRQNGYDIAADWPNNPQTNVAAGTAFLALQRKRTGNLEDGIRAYYQGYQFNNGYNARANQYASEVLNKAFKLGYLGFT